MSNGKCYDQVVSEARKMAGDAARYPHPLWRAILRIREGQDISQEEAAERCGLHRTYYSGERGLRNVSLVIIERIGERLKTALPDVVECV